MALTWQPAGTLTASAGETANWQPVTTRATINPHFLDPNTGEPTRDAKPVVPCRFGRSYRRVLTAGVRTVRLEWRNAYTQVDDPGEVAGPNPVSIRASLEYPAGVWRQVNGSTAWSSTTAYASGDQVTHIGSRWVAATATAAGTAPSTDPQNPWLQVWVYPVQWPGEDTDRRVVVDPGVAVGSEPVDLGDDNRTQASRFMAVNMLAYPTTTGGSVLCGEDSLAADFVLDPAAVPPASDDLVDQPVDTQASLAVGTAMPLPTATLGDSTDTNTVAALGDSLFQGLYDDPRVADTGGFVPRALETTQHYRMGVAGARADSIALGSQIIDWRSEVISRYPVVLTDLGGNDAIRGDGTLNVDSNLAMTQDRMTRLWRWLASRGPRVWATTVTPWTSSTDGWTTLAGQSIANSAMGGTNGLDGVWGRLRDWMTDGAPVTVMGQTCRAGDGHHPLAGIVDVGYAVTDPESGWKWRPNLTTEGMHPNAAGHELLAKALRPYLPALTGNDGLGVIASGAFEGNWSVPLNAGRGMQVTSPVMVTNFNRPMTEPIGCTMSNGVFTPMVPGRWRFDAATQWEGGSNAMRAMFFREVATNAWGNIAPQAAVSDALISGSVLRLEARQSVALYVANWSGATGLWMWDDGGTQFRGTWLGP